MFELGLLVLAAIALAALVGYLQGGTEGVSVAVSELVTGKSGGAQPTPITACGGIELHVGAISYQGDTRALAGVSVTVEHTGEISARSTATRSLLLKQHGWQKKMDNRQLWVTVDGSDFQWVANVPARAAASARQFAAAVNTAARQAALLNSDCTGH